MSLTDNARTLQALGDAIRRQASGNLIDVENVIFLGLSVALREAAEQLNAEVRAEASVMLDGHRCTLDHRTISAPKCPACGAPKVTK